LKIVIDIPPEHYEPFVKKCDSESREYSILINGMVVRHPDSGEKQAIEILCDKEEAVRLLDTASRLYPEAIPALKAGIDNSRVRAALPE
jgi:hypothetical protein